MDTIKDDTYLAVFVKGAHLALRSERLLRGAGLSCKLIPVPRTISMDCGVCLRVNPVEFDTAAKILTDNCIDIEKVHEIN